MVSKARLDLPDPDSPVMTISASRGSSTSMSLRLCSRAPEITICSETATGIDSTHTNRCSRGENSADFALSSVMRNETRSHRGLAGLAERQHGVVSASQLYELGYSKAAISRDVLAGRLHPLHRGAYLVGHAGTSRQARCLAAV